MLVLVSWVSAYPWLLHVQCLCTFLFVFRTTYTLWYTQPLTRLHLLFVSGNGFLHDHAQRQNSSHTNSHQNDVFCLWSSSFGEQSDWNIYHQFFSICSESWSLWHPDRLRWLGDHALDALCPSQTLWLRMWSLKHMRHPMLVSTSRRESLWKLFAVIHACLENCFKVVNVISVQDFDSLVIGLHVSTSLKIQWCIHCICCHLDQCYRWIRLGHPENHLFWLSNIIFIGTKYPINIYYVPLFHIWNYYT